MNNIKSVNYYDVSRNISDPKTISNIRENLDLRDYSNLMFMRSLTTHDIKPFETIIDSYNSDLSIQDISKSDYYMLYINIKLRLLYMNESLTHIHKLCLILEHFIENNFKESVKFNKNELYEFNLNYFTLYNRYQGIFEKLIPSSRDYTSTGIKSYAAVVKELGDDIEKYSYNNSQILKIIDKKQFDKDLTSFINNLNKLYKMILDAPIGVSKKLCRNYALKLINNVNADEHNKNLHINEEDIISITFYSSCKDVSRYSKNLTLASSRYGNLYHKKNISNINEAYNSINDDEYNIKINLLTYILIKVILDDLKNFRGHISNKHVYTFDDFNECNETYIDNLNTSICSNSTYFSNCPLISVENTVKNFIVLPFQSTRNKMNIIYASDIAKRKTVRKCYKYRNASSDEILDSNFNSKSDNPDKDSYGVSYFGNTDEFLTELSFMEGEFKQRYNKFTKYIYATNELEFDHKLENVKLFNEPLIISNNIN